jgi:hypothetical protein
LSQRAKLLKKLMTRHRVISTVGIIALVIALSIHHILAISMESFQGDASLFNGGNATRLWFINRREIFAFDTWPAEKTSKVSLLYPFLLSTICRRVHN